jgi:hypothetical protein
MAILYHDIKISYEKMEQIKKLLKEIASPTATYGNLQEMHQEIIDKSIAKSKLILEKLKKGDD